MTKLFHTDERLENQRNAHAYRAYYLMLGLGAASTLGIFFFTETGRTPVIFAVAAPWWIAMLYFERQNREYDDMVKEQLADSPEARRIFFWRVMRRSLAVASFFFIGGYFPKHDMLEASIRAGISFAAWIGGSYFAMVQNAKKLKEKSSGAVR